MLWKPASSRNPASAGEERTRVSDVVRACQELGEGEIAELFISDYGWVSLGIPVCSEVERRARKWVSYLLGAEDMAQQADCSSQNTHEVLIREPQHPQKKARYGGMCVCV